MSDEPKPTKTKKTLALWQWGVVTILGGVIAGVIMTAGRPTRRLTSAQKAELYGVYTACGLLLLAGIVMIVLHLLRQKRLK